MKKLIFLFVLLSNFSFAQQWTLFPINDTLYYQNNSSNFISNTIIVKPDLINPAKFNISKSIYLCDTCSNINNEEIYSLQSDFLFNHISFLSNQKALLYNDNNDTAALYLSKPIGYTWSYNANITASIISTSTANIFNTIDSIKIILLSNGDSLKVSKNFGLVLFKHSALGYLKLVGDHAKKIGLNLTDYKMYPKVGVNDYLYFEEYSFEGGWGFPCSLTESNLFKIKSIEYDTWGIVFRGISYYTYSGYRNCQLGQYSSGSILNQSDILYLDSIYFNPLPNSLINYGYLNLNFDTSQYNVLTYDKIGNSIRINAIPNYNNSQFRKSSMHNIGTHKYAFDEVDYFDAWIETAIPYFSYKFWDFEYEAQNYLSGYTINGQKFGTIDTNLILGINDLKLNTFSLYPNPNNGVMRIIFTNDNNSEKQIRMYNQLGDLVYKQEVVFANEFEINAINLASGVYTLKISDGNQEQIEKVLIFKNTSQ